MPETVTVACKIPNGLQLQLRSYREEDDRGIKSKVFAPAATRSVRVRGPAVAWGKQPAFVIAGGYALTPNVDKAHWEAWLAENRTNEVVTGLYIFALPKAAEAESEARQMESVKSGLEPINPEKPGIGLERMPDEDRV